MIKNVKLADIYFTQDSMDYNLRDTAGSLRAIFESLKDGKKSIKEITEKIPLNVFKIKIKNPGQKQMFSCNNRKICVFKEYEKYLKKNFPTMLNKNFGLSISVKINDCKNDFLLI